MRFIFSLPARQIEQPVRFYDSGETYVYRISLPAPHDLIRLLHFFGQWKQPGRAGTIPQWRHDMKTLTVLLTLCEGNLPVTGGEWSPHKGIEEFWCFPYCSPDQIIKQIAELPVIWDVITLSCDRIATWKFTNYPSIYMAVHRSHLNHTIHVAGMCTNKWENIRADSRLATSQWETSLQSNAVSHWLGANLESALNIKQNQRKTRAPRALTRAALLFVWACAKVVSIRICQ